MQYVGAVPAEVFEQVAGVVGQSAAVGVEVAQREVGGDSGFGKGKIGVEVGDFGVPGAVFVGDGFSENGRADWLGDGCKLKDCVGVDFFGFADLAEAVSFGKNHFVIKYDRDR